MDKPASSGAEEAIDHTIKVLLVGDSGVGKSSILQRFVRDTFSDQIGTTIGVDFASKTVNVYNKRVKLLLWDTAGQEKFRALTSTFYRGAKGVVLVYDVTNPATLDALDDYWLQELDSHTSSVGPVKVVVANKMDMEDERKVTWDQGMDFAKQHGCLFVEASAKSGVAVVLAFEELVLKILESPSLMADERLSASADVKVAAASTSQSAYCYC